MGEITTVKRTTIQVWHLKMDEKDIMELDGHGQIRDNDVNLLIRFLSVMARRATL